MCPAMQYCDVIANTNLACALPYRRAIDQLSRMIFVCIRIPSGSDDMQSSRFLFSPGIQCNADVVALSLPRASKLMCVVDHYGNWSVVVAAVVADADGNGGCVSRD